MVNYCMVQNNGTVDLRLGIHTLATHLDVEYIADILNVSSRRVSDVSTSSEGDMMGDHLKALTILALSKNLTFFNDTPIATSRSVKRKLEEIADAEEEPEYTPSRPFNVLNICGQEVKISESAGKVAYLIDGWLVPKLQIGEAGRVELKATLTMLLKCRPDLRKETNRICTLKRASICQLLAIAKLCGLWDKVVKISDWYLSRRGSV